MLQFAGNQWTVTILSDSHAVPLRITVAIGYFFCYNGRKWGDLQSEEKGKRTHEAATEEKEDNTENEVKE